MRNSSSFFSLACSVLALSTSALLADAGCSQHDDAAPATGGDDVGTDTTITDDAAPPPDDTADATPPPEDVCAVLKLDERPFDSGAGGTHRHDLAADFTVPLVTGETWSFKSSWSGCESYVFVPDTLYKSSKDKVSIWEKDLDGLVKSSPRNAHYFFVSKSSVDPTADANTAAMQDRVNALLDGMSDEDAAHWRDRLHVVAVRAGKLDGWLKDVLAGIGYQGFAIDRAQRIRGLGNLADVSRFRSDLQAAGVWPFESNLAFAAYEAHMFDAEALTQARLAAEKATVVPFWTGETLAGFAEKDVTLPTPEQMAGFDTLEVEVDQQCPDATKAEFGNCGAWDYIAALSVYDASGTKTQELARFITSYHRETHWVVDATPMLAILSAGGSRKFRWEFAPDWNKQPTNTTLSLRFSNQKKASRPKTATFLWAGGDLGSGYAAAHPPIDVPIPATAKKVELWSIITGHGSGTNQCAEFCNHQHEFTVNGTKYLREYKIVSNQKGCVAESDKGMVPNQGGTWWYGRGGWCPGEQVEPYSVDVTAVTKPGETAHLSYRAMFENGDPPDGSGNIDLSSWLVVYE